MSVPLLIVGDAPFRPTGLSRILTDVVRGITGELIGCQFCDSGLPDARFLVRRWTGSSWVHDVPAEDVFTIVPCTNSKVAGFDVGVVGHQPWRGLPRTGIPVPTCADGLVHHWKNWVFSDLKSHGAEAIQTAYRAWFGDRKGILLSLWDPGRCFAYTQLDLPVERWGYFAVDAANMNGGISGPAGLAVNSYDRVLAYTEFGKRVLSTATDAEIDVLPHGIDLTVFTREMTEAERGGMINRLFPAGYPEGTLLLGCVATNQPRKDLGLFVQVLRELRNRGHQIHGWLHTDRLIGEAWSIPQLASDAQVEDHLTVTTRMTDRELAVAYSLCVATVAPGRGEGFGYPIVESLACGVEAYHGAYGGGEEFTAPWCRVPVETLHLVGPYALQRPILSAPLVADYIEANSLKALHPTDTDLCRQIVQHLDWPTLWPSWAAWLKAGLDHFQENQP